VIYVIVVDVIVDDQHKYCFCVYDTVPILVSAWSKAWVCDLSLAGIAGSNPDEGMNVCLLSVLCVVSWRSLNLSDHSSRGVLPSVVCPVSVNAKPRNGRL
jgi:hypothetical protein